MNTVLHPQYITDESGNRVSVVLPVDEYRDLIARIEDMEDLEEAREAIRQLREGREETIPWETIKAEHGL